MGERADWLQLIDDHRINAQSIVDSAPATESIYVNSRTGRETGQGLADEGIYDGLHLASLPSNVDYRLTPTRRSPCRSVWWVRTG